MREECLPQSVTTFLDLRSDRLVAKLSTTHPIHHTKRSERRSRNVMTEECPPQSVAQFIRHSCSSTRTATVAKADADRCVPERNAFPLATAAAKSRDIQIRVGVPPRSFSSSLSDAVSGGSGRKSGSSARRGGTKWLHRWMSDGRGEGALVPLNFTLSGCV